jgi:hypothetical protein
MVLLSNQPQAAPLHAKEVAAYCVTRIFPLLVRKDSLRWL